jgi:hypothetical protein
MGMLYKATCLNIKLLLPAWGYLEIAAKSFVK